MNKLQYIIFSVLLFSAFKESFGVLQNGEVPIGVVPVQNTNSTALPKPGTPTKPQKCRNQKGRKTKGSLGITLLERLSPQSDVRPNNTKERKKRTEALAPEKDSSVSSGNSSESEEIDHEDKEQSNSKENDSDQKEGHKKNTLSLAAAAQQVLEAISAHDRSFFDENSDNKETAKKNTSSTPNSSGTEEKIKSANKKPVTQLTKIKSSILAITGIALVTTLVYKLVKKLPLFSRKNEKKEVETKNE